MLAQARAFYTLNSADSVKEAEVRAEAKRLADELMLGKGSAGDAVVAGLNLTSATVDGQSFAGTVEMTKGQRLQLLLLIIKMYDEEVALSGRRSYFRGPV